MFKVRLISGILLLAGAILTGILGGPVLFATVLGVSLIGVWEFYRLLGIESRGLGALGYAAVLLYYGLLALETFGRFSGVFWSHFERGWFGFFVMILVIGAMAVYVFTYPRYQAQQVMGAVFGVLYVAVMLSYLFRLRMLEGGAFSMWLIFLCSWGCDTCAYAFGMLFGKHKMAPVLSPKKSVEGALGGVLGAALLSALYALAINRFGGALVVPWQFALICAVGALISMVGDLAASAIKRNFAVKDYGSLIPGHGGILDRFDSVIFTAPIIYFLVYFAGIL